jgi:eukaryotic-like serine/threonine-protein kinase
MGAAMPKLARVPANDSAPEEERAPRRRIRRIRRTRRLKHRYYAFLSYSHKDEELADWLHRELEAFRVPRVLAGRLTANGTIPKRLTPIFRDEQELAAADDLTDEIEAALGASQFLIVLCSPNAAKSRWTNTEIETFKRNHPDGCVLAAIGDGEPFASDIPGREDEECFPPALRFKFDRRGRLTNKRAEPLAADLREGGDGRRMGFLKLVAGMLGVGLDELVQRDTARRQRRLVYVVAASIAGMAVTSTLAVTAIQARDSARDQRREAEGLVAFMLGDLRGKLEPIGRLDALDGVGSRVLAYYSKQDTSELSDASLVQRSRALSLMGEVADLRGDLDGALRLYKEAAAGTAEAVRRDPQDPQRLFDHAQNVYYFGDLAMQRGQLGTAENAFREYKRLANAMVAIQPDDVRWRTEVRYADANLGRVFIKQRRFAEASTEFASALRMLEAVAAIDPKNAEYQGSLAEALAWLADAETSQGHLKNALELRTRQINLLARLRQHSPAVQLRQMLIPARQGRAHLRASAGDLDGGIADATAAVAEAESLIPTEPNNTKWLEFAASAKLSLAQLLIARRDFAHAANRIESGCGPVDRLMPRDPQVVTWRTLARRCRTVAAQLALASGDTAAAVANGQRAVEMAKLVSSGDRVADRIWLAAAYRVLGDAYRRANDRTQAQVAWNLALGSLPTGAIEKPVEIAERIEVLSRAGRAAEAKALADRMRGLGYRQMA